MKLRFDGVAARLNPGPGPSPWVRCRALALGILAFLPIQAWPAISVDFSNGTFADSNTVSWNHTSSGAPNSILLVGLSINSFNNIGLSVTYNGLPLTRTATSGTGNPKAEIWYLWNPPAGTWPVVANITTPDKFCAGSVTYQGVGALGAAANRMTGFTTTADVSLTTTQADSWIFGVVSVGDNATLSSLAGQVSRYSQATTGGGSYNRGAGDDKAMGAPALGTLSWDLGGSFTSGLAALELRAFVGPTATQTPTLSPTPCGLVVSGNLTLTAGTYNYCSVQINAGGTLYIQGAVTLTSQTHISLAAGGTIYGLGNGAAGGPAGGAGWGGDLGGLGGGAAGTGNPGPGGGGSHFSLGGAVAGVTYDDPTAPLYMGSGGGGGSSTGGNIAPGGAGGAYLQLNAPFGTVHLDGTVNMGGAIGTATSTGTRGGGGGGSGGAIYVRAATISGNGSLQAPGGAGGSGLTGGSGGAGGIINLCHSAVFAFSGATVVSGGFSTGAAGSPGQVYSCVSPSLPSAATYSPTPTASPTRTATISPTAVPVDSCLVWAARPSLPAAGREMMAYAWTGTELIIAGGLSPTAQSDVWSYNPATQVWSPKNPIGQAWYSGASVWTGSEMILTSAIGSGDFRYNPVSDTWTAIAPNPVPRTVMAGAYGGGKAYFAGGGTNGTTAQAYDPVSNTWQALAPLQQARYWAAAAYVGGKFYVIGGFANGVGRLNSVEIYDPVGDAWSWGASMPTTRSGVRAAVKDGKIYVVGGRNEAGIYISTVEVYDPATDTWSTESPMSTPRSNAAFVYTGASFLAFGGNNGGDFTDTLEESADSCSSPTPTPTATRTSTVSPTWTATPCSSLSGVGVAIGGGASGTVFSAGLIVGAGADRLLVASIDTDPGVSVVSVSFNGAAFTFAGSSGTNRNLETWYLANPDIANASVQVITSASGAVNFGAVNYRGADTGLPLGVSTFDSRGANTGFNYDLAGVAPGSYVQGHTWTGAGGTIGRGAGQVSMWSGLQAGAVEGDIKTAPGGGTVNLLYTFSLSGVTEARAVEIRTAPCAGGPTVTASPTRSPSPSPTPGAGACASLIRDIRPGATGSSSMLTALLPGDRVVFGADDGLSGSEPWVTDGSFAGTYQIIDLFPGASAGFPLGFTSHGGWVYFAGNNGSVGQELWRTDGSLPGTTLVADIQPGATGSFPTNLFSWGGMLYFTANDGVNGPELWRWDGISATLIKDINVGGGGSNPYGFTDAGAFFYFFAGNGTSGNELWRSDGSTAGTVMVKDINPGAGSSNGGEAVHAGGGILYFAADDGVNGKELWISDGGTPGTVLVKDINPGLAPSNPAKMVWTGLRLLFAADTAAEGRELHFSDGTGPGTLLAADMYPGALSSGPDWLKMMGGAVYFTANNGPFGAELWVTDALGSVVNLVSDINPGATGSSPAGLTLHNGMLYFRATAAAAGLELWRSDGSTGGTTLVQDLNPGAAGAGVDGLRSAGSWLFFVANNGASGTEPFRADDCGAPVATPTASPTPTATRSFTVTPSPTPDLTQVLGNSHWNIGTSSQPLSSTASKLSYRFTQPAARNVTQLRLRYSGGAGTAPLFRAGLQGDAGGLPDGTYITSATVTFTGASWRLVPVAPAALAAGTVYHLVIQHESGTIDAANHSILLSTGESVLVEPGSQAVDPQRAVLRYGPAWSVAPSTPVFVLDYDDATYYGNPYDGGPGMVEVHGAGTAGDPADDRMIAQRFTAVANQTVNVLSLRVSRSGFPTENLEYSLYDLSDGVTVSAGTFLLPGEVNTLQTWYFRPMPAWAQLLAGHEYRFSLHHRGGDASNRYFVAQSGAFASDPFYDARGFGGAASYLESTTTGGSIWSAFLNRDLSFRFFFDALAPTPSPTASPTGSPTPSVTETATPSATETASLTPSGTPSATGSATATPTATPSPSSTVTPTPAPAPPLSGYLGHQSVAAFTYSFFLSSPTAKAAFRFTAPAAKTVSAVRVRVQTILGASPVYRVGLQADNGAGAPDGTWIPGGGPVLTPLAAGWNTAGGLGAALAAGTPYYVVVEYDSGLINGSNGAFLQHGTEPHHRLIPLGQVLDGALEALATTNGGVWSVNARQPEFTVDFSDATSFGCPYHAGASHTIYAGVRTAQIFRGPAADASVNRVGAFVRRGSGLPADDLYFSLEDVTGGTVMESGLLWSIGASSDVAQWVEKDLAQAHSLRAGRTYRLSLYTPGSTLANPFYAIGALADNTTYLSDLSYDGALSHAQQSSDGGGSWTANMPSQDLGFRFSFGLVATPTPSDTRTASPTFSVSPTRTISATRTPSPSPTDSGTVTQTPTPLDSPSPSPTATPCDLIVSGSVVLTSGPHNYCNVVVQSGGLLTINGQVTLNLSGNLQVDSGGTIRGTGNGWPAPGIQSNGTGLGGGGLGNGAGGAGGGGHGGAGGAGSNYLNGGIMFGVPSAPDQMGSSGGSGNTGMGGAGGAALVVNAAGDAVLEGSLEFNGQMGGPGGSANLSSGGGGAGGSVWISAQTISGGGFIQALGGNGGNSGCGTASCWGGGGGGGGRVALCAVLADSFSGPVNVSGGGPGAGNPMAQPGGNGTLYRCVTASDTATATVTATATASPSASSTATPSASPTATETATPSATATVTPSATAVPCAPVVRGVCGVCSYTSVAAALAAAAPCDVIELWESRTENIVINQPLAELRSNAGNRWQITGNSGAATLALGPGITQNLLVRDLLLNNIAGAEPTLKVTGYAPGATLTLRRLYVESTSTGALATGMVDLGSPPTGPAVILEQSEVLGGSDTKVHVQALQPGSFVLRNNLIRNGGRGLWLSGSSASSVGAVLNNTFADMLTGMTWNHRLQAVNNVFVQCASLELEAAGPNADRFDFSYNAFQSTVDTGTFGPANLFGIVPSSEFVDHAAGDLRPANGAQIRDSGSDLSAQGVTVDLDGLARPNGAGFDRGCHEAALFPTPTFTFTTTPSSTISPTFTPVPAPGWHSCAWAWRKPLTLQGSLINGTHVEFPVYISLNDPDLQARARSDGFDLLFTDHDGVTQLAHEIEVWNPGSGELKAWIKVPVLDHGVDRTVFLYYGNPASPDQQNAPAVWSNGFEAVYHLSDGEEDASAAARHGTNNGATLIDGIIAGARHFNPASIDAGAWNPAAGGLTLEGWVWYDSLASDGRVITKAVDDQDQDHVFMLSNLVDKARMRLKTGTSDSLNTVTLVGAATLTVNRWTHLAATFDGMEMRLYVDGVLDAAAGHPNPGALRANNWPVWMGDNPSGLLTQHFGRLDEVRVARVARPAGWMATQYANQSNPGAFVAVSGQQASACATATPTESPSFTATPTGTPSATATATPSWTPSATPSATESATPTATSSQTPSATVTASPTQTATPTATPSATPSATESATPTATSSQTPSATVTASPTQTATATASPSATSSATESATPTATPSQTPSATVTASPTQTATPTPTPSATPSATESATPSRTASFTPTATFTLTATETATPLPSPTATPTLTATETVTPLPSPTATPTLTATVTVTFTHTHTPFVTATPTPSITDTPLPTATPETPAVLSHNVWRPGLGQPLHIGIKSPVGGRVTVNVYNVAAERVRRPFEADVPAGVTVDALWDGRNDQGELCGAGVYLVSIRGAGIQRTLKVVLLK